MAVLVVSLLLMLSLTYTTQQQVVITPNGPLCIPINTPTSINCSYVGGRFVVWIATFSDGSTVSGGFEGLISPGIVVTYIDVNSFSSIFVNTMNTSLFSLECRAMFPISGGSSQEFHDKINITTYGAPEPPEGLLYQVYENSINTSWVLHRIDKINVSFSLSLNFHEPSKLESHRVNTSDVRSYNFSVEGFRSCDYFTFCVRASNDAGLGNESCINGSLLYIPTEDNIDYSLSRHGENFTLIVIIMVPAICLVNLSSLSYTIEVIGEQNESMRSDTVPADSKSNLQVNNLLENKYYSFGIESHNSNNRDYSIWIEFFTSDVQGINICLTNKDGFFTISCNYVNGSDLPGCGYRLTGSNVMEFNRTIVKDDSHTEYIPDIMKYQNITITDIDSTVLFEKTFSNNVTRCDYTTDPSNSSTTATTNNSSTSNRIFTVIIAVVIPVVSLILLLLSIAFVIYLCWKGYCLWPFNPVSKHVLTGREPAGSLTQELNGKQSQDVMTSDKSQDTDIDTAGTYSSLQRLHTPHEANTMEKVPEAEYSQLKSSEPVYHVLEKETPLVSEDISADPDAPAVPPFCPSGGDTPPVAEVQQTTSTTDDFMYAEIGNIRAKK